MGYFWKKYKIYHCQCPSTVKSVFQQQPTNFKHISYKPKNKFLFEHDQFFIQRWLFSSWNWIFCPKFSKTILVPIFFIEPKIVDPSSRKHNLVVLVFIVVGQAFHHIFRQSMKIQSWQIPSIYGLKDHVWMSNKKSYFRLNLRTSGQFDSARCHSFAWKFKILI